MTTQNLGLMKALNAKMAYLNHRQRIVSQNIANSDTPGYQPKDLTKIDFSKVLKNVESSGKKQIHIETSNNMHLSGGSDALKSGQAKQQKKGLYEVSPSGNAVIMEQQLIKSNEIVVDYNMMSGLYKKQMGMMRMVLQK